MNKGLIKADFQSDTWKRLIQHLEIRLERFRKKNDSNLSESETTKLRGRIAELKFLLDLDKNPDPATTSDADL